MLLFCIKLYFLCNELTYDKFICPFDMEMFTKKTYVILLSDFNETQCFNACDEFPIGCNPHKNQTLSVWVSWMPILDMVT